MSITSGKVIVLTGLAALALSACGGDDGPLDGYPWWATASSGTGTGGQGGEPPAPEVDVIDCEGITPDYLINGVIDVNFNGSYDPAALTIKVGEVVEFFPEDTVQNMESGVNEVKDGKFHTPQGRRACLRFNVPGTYPFFSLGSKNPMLGTLYVE